MAQFCQLNLYFPLRQSFVLTGAGGLSPPYCADMGSAASLVGTPGTPAQYVFPWLINLAIQLANTLPTEVFFLRNKKTGSRN